MLAVYLLAHLRGHRRRRRNGSAVRAHHFAAERLLLVRALHHEHAAVEPEERARHRKRRSPLSRAGLGRHALQSLRLGVVGLRDGGVQLVRTRSVVALELVVYLRGRAQCLLEKVRSYKRRGTEHPVEIAYLLRNREERRMVVKLLLDEIVAKHRRKVVGRARLEGGRHDERRGLFLHVRAHVVPLAGHLVL